jgi:hypothetical protein
MGWDAAAIDRPSPSRVHRPSIASVDKCLILILSGEASDRLSVEPN